MNKLEPEMKTEIKGMICRCIASHFKHQISSIVTFILTITNII